MTYSISMMMDDLTLNQIDTKRLIKHLLSTTFFCGLVVASASPAYANPQDGVVSAGQAHISVSGNQTTINQATDKAIIDWRGFDVNVDESVRFQQPSTASITLNRIRSGQASQIDGQVSANGNIIIVNPDGVIFGNNSRIDANGLVAATSDIDDNAFMNGANTVTFDRHGNPNAKIENKGHITVKEAGLVGLVAPHVENSGVIEARMGKVTLAGTEHITVDFAGDGLISFATDIQANTSQHIVKNSGQIKADGGEIYLAAVDARGIVDQLIENTGTLEALSVDTKQGHIILRAERNTNSDHKSKALNSGVINASGKASGQKGGNIEVLADFVALQSGSTIDVSGANGGGTAKIGGDWQGNGNTQRSRLTVVEENTKIDASAIENGNGGTVVVWSEDTTGFYGNIDAKGGMESGDGGNVEVSGKKFLDFQGLVNTKATNGKNGSLLLDPTNIRIADVASDQNVATVGFLTYEPSGDDVTSVLDIDTVINNLYSNGNVVIQTRASGSQEGDIIWDAAAYYDCYDCGGNTITLDAHDDIILNQSVSGSLNFYLLPGDDVEINAPWFNTLNILPKDLTSDVFLGGTGAGTEISAASLANMSGGAGITIGSGGTHTGNVYISGDRDWSGFLSVNTAGDVFIADNQDFGTQSLDITARDLSLPGQINGNSLSLNSSVLSDMGLGDGMGGDFHLTSAEWERVGDDWVSISLGDSGLASNIKMEGKTAKNWRIFTYGDLEITGDLIAETGDVDITAGDLDFTGALSGGAGLRLASVGTGMGLGDGMAGSFHLTDAEFDRVSGFSNYNISSIDNISLGQKNWDGNLSLSTGVLNVYGEQNLAQGKYLNLSLSDLNLNEDLVGDGNITFNTSSSLGLGDGASGGVVYTNDTLNHIKEGWSKLQFYTSGNVDINARNWHSDLEIQGQNITINGNQSFGSNDATFVSNGIDIAGQLQGTGTLILDPSGSVGLAGQAGAFNLTTAELNNIVDGWSEIVIGDTQSGVASTMLVGAHTWLDPLRLRIGGNNSTLRIQGAQTMGSNNLTIQSNGLIDLNAPVTGSGILTLQQRTTNVMVVGFGGSTLNTRITDSDINSFVIGQGWDGVILGSDNSTGTFNLTRSFNWGSDLTIQSRGTVFNISTAQNVGNNDLTIRAYNGLNVSNTLTGTGTLKIEGITDDRSIVVGSSTGGNIAVDDAEISRFADGWNKIVFGKDTGSNVIINSALFNDSVEIHSGTNVQFNYMVMGANDLSVFSNNIAMNSTITGTGNLLFRRTTPGTYNIGNSAYLDAAEISNIQDGWSKVTFGDIAGTDSFIFSDAVSFADSAEFLTNTGSITLNDTVRSTAGTENALTFVAGNGRFNNNAGSGAIDPGAGRYLIYLNTINGSDLRGLDIPTRRFGSTYTNTSPYNVPNTGNVLLFSALRSDAIDIPENVTKVQANLQSSLVPSGYYFNNPMIQTPEVQENFGLEDMNVYNDYRPVFTYTVSDDVIIVNEDEKNQEKL